MLATKAGIAGTPDTGNRAALSPDGLRASVDGSLRRLGVETDIDLFYLHQPDRATPPAETLDTVAALVANGKITALGVSNYGRLADERAQPGRGPCID